MSKGLGRIERDVLGVLAGAPDGLKARGIALRLSPFTVSKHGNQQFYDTPTPALYSAVRRGIVSLNRNGLSIFLLGNWQGGWATRHHATAYAAAMFTMDDAGAKHRFIYAGGRQLVKLIQPTDEQQAMITPMGCRARGGMANAHANGTLRISVAEVSFATFKITVLNQWDA